MISEDERFISRCIQLSEDSMKNGGAPFGALIVKEGKIFVDSINNAQERISDHAEILVMNKAHKLLGKSDLSSCTLYTNCEPCPMCVFMAREYKLKKIVFAVHSSAMGGFSKWKILQDEELSTMPVFFGKPPEIIPGILENEARQVFDRFSLLANIFGTNVKS